ncbi:CRISPR-associated endonuclease Cas2 [Cuniculiplasma divulgatum]|uniref:CRISPR-associated endoribonuclease Cas2 n=1 Tax=Cuniculiplasma divulgatum TaxID=1673428 RepID=A0A1R4A8V3_9ARCH|nr:CRISPR-associated endonuclease Cas2 [Cuniculiplasma divulgatum]MCI2412721.1 CRISPR-associated endonuclease Cas2 [Cuniculiplasma sp.]SJK85391.1 CRISPR-associated protein Cas2 [Cuniculiplasma divulgatum]
MFVIMFYDIRENRVVKALKISRKYLTWIQNSVFEGEISLGNLSKLKAELKRAINSEEDSIIIYTLSNTKYTKRELIGIEKNTTSNIL